MMFETRRLIARAFRPDDLETFVAMRADAEVARYQNWEKFSLAEGQAFIAGLAARAPGDPGWFQFALEEKANGAFAGDCGLRVLETDGRLAQIGYTIRRELWNRGYASEAVRALVAYAFAAFDFHRITASVDPRNLGSCRVLEKAGFRREALFRQSEWFKGAWADDVVYALLRADLGTI